VQNTYHKIILIFILILVSSFSFAENGRRKHFLSHGSGVASFAAGETLFSGLKDPAVIQYNPSVLALQKENGVSMAYFELFEGSGYNSASLALGLGGNYYAGASASNLSSGKIELRESIYSAPRGASINTWNYILSMAGFADKFGIAYGLSAKYLYYDLYEASGGTFLVDAGFSKFLKGPEISGSASKILLGFSAQNFALGELKVREDADDIPSIYRLSSAFSIPLYYRFQTQDTVNVYADLKYEDEFLDVYAGLAYIIAGKYALRAGYYAEHFTFGFGVEVFGAVFDYSADFSEMDFIHRFGISYKWGSKKNKDALYAEAKEALDREKLTLKEAEVKFNKAKKFYNAGQYLRASDLLSTIIVSYPNFESPLHFYNKIDGDMRKIAYSDDELDFGKYTYAKGFCAYYKTDYKDALNQWDKHLQFAGDNEEIKEYYDKINDALKLEKLRLREEALDKEALAMLEKGIAEFKAQNWISCIKAMEKLQKFVKENNFSKAIEYYSKAKDYIDKSVAELTKLIKNDKKSQGASEDVLQGAKREIDEEGAGKKYNEGLVLYAQGRYFEAERAWELALRLNPDHQKAKIALSKIRQMSK
jgi:tetratricopeptide (TPR) repeat protein